MFTSRTEDTFLRAGFRPASYEITRAFPSSNCENDPSTSQVVFSEFILGFHCPAPIRSTVILETAIRCEWRFVDLSPERVECISSLNVELPRPYYVGSVHLRVLKEIMSHEEKCHLLRKRR